MKHNVITTQPSRVLEVIRGGVKYLGDTVIEETNKAIRRGANFENYTVKTGTDDGYDNGKGKYGEEEKDCCEKATDGCLEATKILGGIAAGVVGLYLLLKCCENIKDSPSRGGYQSLPGNNVSGFSTRSDNINLASDVGNRRNHN